MPKNKKSLKLVVVGFIFLLTLVGNLYGFPIIGATVPFPWESTNPGYHAEKCAKKLENNPEKGVDAICAEPFADSCVFVGRNPIRGFPLVSNRAGKCGDGFSQTSAIINIAVGVGSLIYLVKLVRPETKGKKKNARK